jgi:hypothetical protein
MHADTKPSTTRPEPSEYSQAVSDYIALVPPGDLVEILATQHEDLVRLVGRLTDEEALVRHAPYTWSIKQVLGHLADCERVFGYRAMRLARGDATPLRGFDENAYVRAGDFDRLKFGRLLVEFSQVRQSNVLMLTHLPATAWLHKGVVNGHPMTTRAVVCVMAGHFEHHLRILRKRLGV